jgi:uncharacterized membrane protein
MQCNARHSRTEQTQKITTQHFNLCKSLHSQSLEVNLVSLVSLVGSLLRLHIVLIRRVGVGVGISIGIGISVSVSASLRRLQLGLIRLLRLHIKILHQVWDIVVVVFVLSTVRSADAGAAGAATVLGLDRLVRLGELAQGGERVRAELVEDARDELGELLDLTGAVDGEGVGGKGGVNCDVG